jgi:hypothetical protein
MMFMFERLAADVACMAAECCWNRGKYHEWYEEIVVAKTHHYYTQGSHPFHQTNFKTAFWVDQKACGLIRQHCQAKTDYKLDILFAPELCQCTWKDFDIIIYTGARQQIFIASTFFRNFTSKYRNLGLFQVSKH